MRKNRLYAVILALAVTVFSTACADVGLLARSASEVNNRLQAELAKRGSSEVQEDLETEAKDDADSEVESNAKSDKSDKSDGDSSSSEKSKSDKAQSDDKKNDKSSDSDKDGNLDSKSDDKSSAKSDSKSDKAKTTDADDADDTGSSDGDNAEEETKPSVLDSLPKVGSSIHGFKVTDISDYAPKNAKIVSMTHEQSGAELIYIACDDADKAFAVYYRTSAESDQGIPHIFEHVTLSGSGKYPNSNLFDALASGTYNTYMNASTWQEYTGYTMSSLSDEQLLKIADFYMSGLTDPLALRDSNPLGREAYRFEMSTLDDDISVTGAVFNEMEAANADIFSYSYRKALKLLYPDSRMSHNSGGYRDDIITVDTAQLKSYYNKYYHPSNMLITMYGDMDYEEYLEFLDEEYLSKYESKTVNISDPKYIPWTGEKQASVDYPVTEDASDEDSGMVQYMISLGEVSAYDSQLMNVVASFLGMDNSPLKKKMDAEFPNASFGAYIISDIDEPVMAFYLQGSNKGDGEKFKAKVDEGIAEVVENGIDKELIEALTDIVEMQNAMSQEEPGGIGTLNNFASSWAIYGDKLAYLDKQQAFDELPKTAKNGKLDELIEKYLSNPTQSVIAEINPRPGLKESEDEAFAAKLADKKASMTKTELAELVGSTAMFEAWSEMQDDTDSYMEELSVVDKDELEENVQSTEVEDETTDEGVRILSSKVDDAVYLSSDIYLKADTLDYDEIHDMVFLGELLGKLSTDKHTADELSTAITKSIYNFSTGLTVIYDDATGAAQPYYEIQALSAEGNIDDTFSLIEEILTKTDFTDTERIKNAAATAALEYKSSNTYELAVAASEAAGDTNKRYEYHAMQTDYLNYLNKVSRMSDKQLKSLGKELSAVLGKLLNVNGVIYTAVGSEDSINKGSSLMKELAGSLEVTPLPAVDYSTELDKLNLPQSIAVAINDSVNYNGIAASNDALGITNDGKNYVALSVIYNKLLYPSFRYDIGAYGLLYRISDKYTVIMSYRDPETKLSFETLEKLPEAVSSLEVGESDVDNALLTTYSSYAYPLSKLELAHTEIDYILQDKSESYSEETLENMKSAKSTTAKDVTEFADTLSEMLDKGVRFTAGSSDSIKKNKELYELTITELTK